MISFVISSLGASFALLLALFPTSSSWFNDLLLGLINGWLVFTTTLNWRSVLIKSVREAIGKLTHGFTPAQVKNLLRMLSFQATSYFAMAGVLTLALSALSAEQLLTSIITLASNGIACVIFHAWLIRYRAWYEAPSS